MVRIVVLHCHLEVRRQHPCVNAATAPNVDCAGGVKSCQHAVHCLVWVHPLLHLPFVKRVVVRGSSAIVAALHIRHSWISTNSDIPHAVLAVSAVDACVLELLNLLLLEKLRLFKLLDLFDGRKL